MDATLCSAAFNPIIAEARGVCHGLYRATTGETLVQGAGGLPIFVGALAFIVALDLTVAGDTMVLDFSRSSPPIGSAQHLQRHLGGCRPTPSWPPPRRARWPATRRPSCA